MYYKNLYLNICRYMKIAEIIRLRKEKCVLKSCIKNF